MNALFGAAAIAAVALVNFAPAARAAKLCGLTGTYTEQYGIATANIKGLKGQLVAPKLCATPYNFKITNETQTGFTVTGNNKTKSCGTFTANPTFMGSCEVFGGTITLNGQQYSDVFTEQNTARHAPARDAGLTRGLK